MKRSSNGQATEVMEPPPATRDASVKHLEAASVSSQSTSAGQSYELIKSTQVWKTTTTTTTYSLRYQRKGK